MMAAHSLTDGGGVEPKGTSVQASRAAAIAALLEGATGHALLTIDAGGRITSWSPGARDLFGWDEAEGPRPERVGGGPTR
jgi:PAS domain-containing protein